MGANAQVFNAVYCMDVAEMALSNRVCTCIQLGELIKLRDQHGQNVICHDDGCVIIEQLCGYCSVICIVCSVFTN